MVGITDAHFKKGEPCWIVVESPYGKEYLHGEFLWELPYQHPSYQLVRKQTHHINPNTKAVKARITDPRVKGKNPIEALEYGKEPYRNYTVMPANTYTNNLVEQVEQLRYNLQRAQDNISTLEGLLLKVAFRKE
ncbi:MAG: hypothetical protein Q7S55_00435 [Nanoarchaeota archaeon]|nr:hypothetical protein [Nanoarchaeota archaeon]